jgi:hypothetical protein
MRGDQTEAGCRLILASSQVVVVEMILAGQAEFIFRILLFYYILIDLVPTSPERGCDDADAGAMTRRKAA